jgi:hypothetical protein
VCFQSPSLSKYSVLSTQGRVVPFGSRLHEAPAKSGSRPHRYDGQGRGPIASGGPRSFVRLICRYMLHETVRFKPGMKRQRISFDPNYSTIARDHQTVCCVGREGEGVKLEMLDDRSPFSILHTKRLELASFIPLSLFGWFSSLIGPSQVASSTGQHPYIPPSRWRLACCDPKRRE